MVFHIGDYLNALRAEGKYTLTLNELREKSELSDKAILQTLFRAKKSGDLYQLRRGFYLIIPPEHAIAGVLPIYLYIDDLMRFLHRDYYISLFSAAMLYGAAHQQPMNHQIMLHPPALRNMISNKLDVRFFIQKEWNRESVVDKKTAGGYIKVSSPELTFLDLVTYHHRIGGVSRILPVLESLVDEVNYDKFSVLIDSAVRVSVLQRVGFILDRVLQEKELSEVLEKKLEKLTLREVPLSLLDMRADGKYDRKWKININIDGGR